ncbi:hypothetical protein [Frateuria soli]|nr:hypothetical protein [Frateuria soli]
MELAPNSGNVLAFQTEGGRVVAVRLEGMVFVRDAPGTRPTLR